MSVNARNAYYQQQGVHANTVKVNENSSPRHAVTSQYTPSHTLLLYYANCQIHSYHSIHSLVCNHIRLFSLLFVCSFVRLSEWSVIRPSEKERGILQRIFLSIL
jgi:hypothetical protein